MSWQVRLRRTQASRHLRQHEKDEQMDFFESQAWENKSPIQLRRMLSSASSLFHRSTPPLPAKSPLRYEQAVAVDHCSSIYEESDCDEASYNNIRYTHKDSVVAFTGPTATQCLPPEKLQDNPDSPRPPSNTHSIDSVSSTIRFNAQRPLLHKHDCMCHACRQIRHYRRKATLKLAERIETCREIVTTIRDPSDPSDLRRGRVYGHWLKLARLYTKYEMLLEVQVANILEENMMFVHYMQAFRAVEKLVEDEKIEWGRLFGEQCADRVEVESAQLIEVSLPKRHKDSITGYQTSGTSYDD